MLKNGTVVVVTNGSRDITVQPGNHGLNTFNYGNSALSNDFDFSLRLQAALSTAKNGAAVVAACKKYARYNKADWKEVTDY